MRGGSPVSELAPTVRPRAASRTLEQLRIRGKVKDLAVHDLERDPAVQRLGLRERRERDATASGDALGEEPVVLGPGGQREVDVEGDGRGPELVEALDRRRVDAPRPGPVFERAQAARIDRDDRDVGQGRGRFGNPIGDEPEEAVVDASVEVVGHAERMGDERQCEHGESR